MSLDPFCKREETRGTVFYETKHFMLLYDIRPVVRGHMLFVSKRHVEDVLELTQEEVADMHAAFRIVIPKTLDIYCPEDRSYDLTSQIGRYSGRTIPHLHFHLLPRFKSDGYQGSAASTIFEDLALNKTHFTARQIAAEVKLLRKEFSYSLQH